MQSKPHVLTQEELATKGVARGRLTSIDYLRGVVMVLMALDHTREYFAPKLAIGPDSASALAFATRWITHLCAPTFIFLAGISAWLYASRGKSKRELALFLLSRGIWLIAVDVILLNPGLNIREIGVGVLWAIGWSMVILSGLVFMPTKTIGIFGAVVLIGHNALDHIAPERFGPLGNLWRVLHIFGKVEYWSGFYLKIGYPLLPWAALMALGYVSGPLAILDVSHRRRHLLTVGFLLLAGFALLRWLNIYGDPERWRFYDGSLFRTTLSFLDCEKYPPSLLYLCVTMGCSLLLWAYIEGGSRQERWIVIFGSVPFFFYLLHLFTLYFAKMLFRPIIRGEMDFATRLLLVYCVWALLVLLCYPLCARFCRFKRESRRWWTSYL